MGLLSNIFGAQKTTLEPPFEQLKLHCVDGTGQLSRYLLDAGIQSDQNGFEILVLHLIIANHIYVGRHVKNRNNSKVVDDFICTTFTEAVERAENHTLSKDELTELVIISKSKQEEYHQIIVNDLRNHARAGYPELSSHLANELYKSPQDITKAIPVINKHLKNFFFIVSAATMMYK